MTADLDHLKVEADAAPARRDGAIDLQRAAGAVADLLDALGAGPTSSGLSGTPDRVAQMLGDLLSPAAFHPTTFPNDAGYDELVLVSDIGFTSLCEQHLLPFRGVAHVGYLPGARLIGLSKVARLVDAAAGGLQRQERLTTQIAGWLDGQLAPRGCGVVVEAEHLCAALAGAPAHETRSVTSSLHGLLRERPEARQEFLQLARGGAGGHH